ncbi:MAG: glutamate racemase [Plesiomonas sp.]|uniref:glutamate racemase n=1 Tax=Plesiomonas sp. TaxID=2486279 RepID=UPI003EE4497F
MTSDRKKHQPTVLVFDSGVGGLSIYQEIRQRLPDLHYIYAFDNACFPYGEQPEALIIERVLAIVSAIASQHPLDMVIIACNTASTITLPALRARFAIPIVGVVPAIKPAAERTRNGIIGLLATRATVKRPYTHQLISQFASQHHVKLLGSAELVQLAEQKMQGQPIAPHALRHILAPWLTPTFAPDTIVLACTHFPLLKEELQQIFPSHTQLIDSGSAVAKRVEYLLTQQNGLSTTVNSTQQPKNQSYCTLWDTHAEQLQPLFTRENLGKLQKLVL